MNEWDAVEWFWFGALVVFELCMAGFIAYAILEVTS